MWATLAVASSVQATAYSGACLSHPTLSDASQDAAVAVKAATRCECRAPAGPDRSRANRESCAFRRGRPRRGIAAHDFVMEGARRRRVLRDVARLAATSQRSLS